MSSFTVPIKHTMNRLPTRQTEQFDCLLSIAMVPKSNQDDEEPLSPKDRENKPRPDRDLGGYDPSERIGEGVKVGDPQIRVQEKERSVTSILKELAAIQQQGPQKYCILGTRHCSYLHQQIIELL